MIRNSSKMVLVKIKTLKLLQTQGMTNMEGNKNIMMTKILTIMVMTRTNIHKVSLGIRKAIISRICHMVQVSTESLNKNKVKMMILIYRSRNH